MIATINMSSTGLLLSYVFHAIRHKTHWELTVLQNTVLVEQSCFKYLVKQTLPTPLHTVNGGREGGMEGGRDEGMQAGREKEREREREGGGRLIKGA